MTGCRRLAAAAVAVAAACALGSAARADEPAVEPAPKATLYAFFATWCVPCRVELPHIERLHRTYAARGLRVVLVSEDAPSTAANVPAFLARFDVTAPWVVDTDSAILERYNPTANVPFTVVVDAAGGIVYAHSGYEPGDERLVEVAVIKALARDAVVASSSVRVTSTTQGLGVWRESKFDPVEANDERLAAAVGRIEVTGTTRELDVGVRVDGAVVDLAETAGADDARLERVYAEYDFGDVAVRAGDDYAAFGHGVSLSLRKVDPLGLDTSLRGGRIDSTYGGVRVTALGGVTNQQNLDPIELRVVDDDSDVIAGAEVSISVGDAGAVAPYAVVAHASDASAFGNDIMWTLGGASTSLQFGRARVSAEVAGGQRTEQRDDMDDNVQSAYAGYAAAQWATGPVTALVDAKYYRHWRVGRGGETAYHEPPTLEREDQEVPGNEDAVGGRARVEYRLPVSATVFGNLLAYRYAQDGSDPFDGDLAVHGYVGGEKRFGSAASAALQAGYRVERLADGGGDKLTLWQLDVDGATALTRAVGLTLKWNHRSETKTLTEQQFVRGLAVAGFAVSGVGVASVLYGYSTERSAQVAPRHYPAAEMLLHLPKGGDVRLFVGRLTGGRVCVSGSCRDVPPFEGARLDLILRL